MTAAAAVGRFELQQCAQCGAVQYPPREACHRCLSGALRWTAQSGAGELISQTTLFHSQEPYFKARLPWRIGLIRLEAGPVVIAHLHGSLVAPAPVRVVARLDRSAQAALVAVPARSPVEWRADPQLRELTLDPAGRNVLLTENDSTLARELLSQLQRTGARMLRPGIAGQEVEPHVDVLIHCAVHAVDPVPDPPGPIEANYFGLVRLVERFGPALKDRAAATGAPVAWVNVLPVDALGGGPAGDERASALAATLCLTQWLRTDMQPAGVRVVNVFAADVGAKVLVRGILAGLRDGLEDVFLGAAAEDWRANWLESRATGN